MRYHFFRIIIPNPFVPFLYTFNSLLPPLKQLPELQLHGTWRFNLRKGVMPLRLKNDIS
jgi:hypothetical protein